MRHQSCPTCSQSLGALANRLHGRDDRCRPWAQEREAIAHVSSGKIGVTSDPAREYTRAKYLLSGFKQLDRVITLLP
jgi:hypothetical protein